MSGEDLSDTWDGEFVIIQIGIGRFVAGKLFVSYDLAIDDFLSFFLSIFTLFLIKWKM